MILPEYTDEHLRDLAANGSEESVRERARLLLSVPAEQRQRIEAAVTRQTTRTEYVDTGSDTGMLMGCSHMIGSPDEARRALVADYLRSQEG